MKVILQKENHVIVNYCEASDLTVIPQNNYPKIISQNLAYPDWMVDVEDAANVPDGTIINKYCYTSEDGFYINPDWVEPDETNVYGVPDEVYHQIIDDYTLELVGGAVNE